MRLPLCTATPQQPSSQQLAPTLAGPLWSLATPWEVTTGNILQCSYAVVKTTQCCSVAVPDVGVKASGRCSGAVLGVAVKAPGR